MRLCRKRNGLPHSILYFILQTTEFAPFNAGAVMDTRNADNDEGRDRVKISTNERRESDNADEEDEVELALDVIEGFARCETTYSHRHMPESGLAVLSLRYAAKSSETCLAPTTATMAERVPREGSRSKSQSEARRILNRWMRLSICRK